MRDLATIQTPTADFAALNSIETTEQTINKLQQAIESVIKGKTETVKLTIVALLARGHLLLEDVPGVGKTTLAQSLARALDCSFQRIQFTSDLLPSDVLGRSIFNQRESVFEWQPGPIFANVVLADEINRATPKTQSALLEAMAEGQVTAEGVTTYLPNPFIVVATQNPLEHHGTYPLPESQLDRFLLRLEMGYPNLEAEKRILRERRTKEPLDLLRPVLAGADVVELQNRASEVKVKDELTDYLMQIVTATRTNEKLELGISPRGTLAIFRAAQAFALLDGRDFCIADDIKRLVKPCFAHRVIVNSRFASPLNRVKSAETVLQEIINQIRVPV